MSEDNTPGKEFISQRQALQKLGISRRSFEKVAATHGISFYTKPPLKTFYVSAADVQRVADSWSRQAGAATNGR